MTTPLRALVVEDSEEDTLLLVEELRRGDYEPSYVRVETAEAMTRELGRQVWDIVFSDFTMPQFTAFDALAQLRKSGIDIPFVIVSGTIGEDRAVMAMKAGAHDYVLKDNLKRLVPAVERELREAANRSERKQAEETVRYLAYHDPLTDLPNRIHFQEAAQRAIEASLRERRLAAILLMNLARFQEVNDTLGHQQGDWLLRQVGLRLRTAAEPELVARLGGDEFGLLLSGLKSAEEIERAVGKVRDMLDAPIMIEGVPVAVEAYIGVAIAPQHATDANTLMQRADVAMHRAKQTGDEFSAYAPEHDSYSPERLALAAELRSAIERGELLLHYQPIIDLETGQVVAAEALVRWQHPALGLLQPEKFIGMTERTGLIKPLTRWVLAASLKQQHIWRYEGKTWRTGVNLSPRLLPDPRLPEQVEQLLRSHQVEPGQLKLEITESAVILEPKRALETLGRLKRLGVLLSIDDFGAGYTSLGYLKNLPFDEIKIDKSFVLNMLQNRSDAAIVRSVIDLGHHLGLKVVAEGVEDERVRERLKALGCDYAQGYCFSPAIPSDALPALSNAFRGRGGSPKPTNP